MFLYVSAVAVQESEGTINCKMIILSSFTHHRVMYKFLSSVKHKIDLSSKKDKKYHKEIHTIFKVF